MKHTTMKHRVFLSSLSGIIHDHINDLREFIDLSEQYLKKETTRLEKRVIKELKVVSTQEEKEFTIGWYTDVLFVSIESILSSNVAPYSLHSCA
jgi:hypothetical protein